MERTITALAVKLTLTENGVHIENEYVNDEGLIAIALYALRKDLENDDRVKRAWKKAAKVKIPAGMN